MHSARRIRFKVPESELLMCKAVMLEHKLTSRQWVDMSLSYLCCPSQPRPPVRAVPKDPDIVDFDFRWPRSVIEAVDPGLRLAELSLPALLSTTWAWLHAPDGKVSAGLARRLAAFASYFQGGQFAKHWECVHPPDSTASAWSPHQFLYLGPVPMPWNQP